MTDSLGPDISSLTLDVTQVSPSILRVTIGASGRWTVPQSDIFNSAQVTGKGPCDAYLLVLVAEALIRLCRDALPCPCFRLVSLQLLRCRPSEFGGCRLQLLVCAQPRKPAGGAKPHFYSFLPRMEHKPS